MGRTGGIGADIFESTPEKRRTQRHMGLDSTHDRVATSKDKPITVEALTKIPIKITKAAREDYVFEFVNVVREHLGLELLVEPEEWKEECLMERERAKLDKSTPEGKAQWITNSPERAQKHGLIW
jgi:hypothetical protein